MPTGDALTLCKHCLFWDHRGNSEGLCRRHAPSVADRPLQVVRWAESRATDGCGEGEPVDGADAKAGTGQTCGTCRFWHRPGEGIEPGLRGDHLAAWWRQAGLCRRFAPRPRVDFGSHAFWRATHATDHCFDGRPA